LATRTRCATRSLRARHNPRSATVDWPLGISGPPRPTTPEHACQAPPKAHPHGQPSAHFRIRHDTVDQFGKLTLRHGSRLHHLGIGRTHAATPVLILVTATTVTVVSKTHHRVLSSHRIEPDRNYWRNQNKNPRPMAGESVTDDATHL
jgi:hypothetical protein